MSRKNSNVDLPVGCAHHQGLSRRRFLAGCAACAGAAGLAGTPSWLNAASRLNPGAGQLKIRVVYALHGPQQEGPDWPNKGFDFVPVMDRINRSWPGAVPNANSFRPWPRARSSPRRSPTATRAGISTAISSTR